MNVEKKTVSVPYKDRSYILLGVCFITLSLTFVGTDHDFNELFSTIILKKLCFNAVFVALSWLGIRTIIIFFDKRLPWIKGNNQLRWVLQIVATFAFTSLISLLALCSRTLFIPTWKFFPKTIWLTDFPLSLLFTLGFSFLYYHWWTQNEVPSILKTTPAHTPPTIIPKVTPSAPTIAVKKGKNTHLLPAQKIAYAFRLDDFNYIVIQSGEKFLLDSSLNTIEQELSEYDFFRLNRQLLAHRTAIQSFQILPNRHLQVILQPTLAGNLLVNKNKVSSFKQWMNP